MRKSEHFQMQIEDCRHHTIECTMEQRRRGFDVCGRGFARQNGVMDSGEGEDEVVKGATHKPMAYSLFVGLWLIARCLLTFYIERYKLSIEKWCRSLQSSAKYIEKFYYRSESRYSSLEALQ
jgi:hypothetical protein